jgi:dTDP-4-dehydrorhamnose reductase
MKILLTGGSGLLGTELQKLLLHDEVVAPRHEDMDITNPSSWQGDFLLALSDIDIVIHAAAYTDVVKAEVDPQCIQTNVVGTSNVINAFGHLPFVFISSEYATWEGNVYARTKKLGEQLVARGCPTHLIIRTLFKPRPFPFPRAFVDQFTMGDYVDVIAPLIIAAIKNWDLQGGNLTYIGTGRKTIYELAQESNAHVGQISIDEITNVRLPKDYL